MDKMNTKDKFLNYIKKDNGLLAKVIVWLIIISIISGETAVIIHYSIHDHYEEIQQTIEYDYFDKFCQILTDTAPNVYGNMSRSKMVKEYDIWYTNKGYASIIIDDNGNLTTVFCIEDTVDMLNYYLLTGETNF